MCHLVAEARAALEKIAKGLREQGLQAADLDEAGIQEFIDNFFGELDFDGVRQPPQIPILTSTLAPDPTHHCRGSTVLH